MVKVTIGRRAGTRVTPAAGNGGMTLNQPIPDAVLFLSPAQGGAGLPPELEGTSGASPLERMAGRLQQEGFVRLRVILLNDEQGPQFRHRLVRGLLDRIGRRAATVGIELKIENAVSLEDWLSVQPDEIDWIVQRPCAAELAATPYGLPSLSATSSGSRARAAAIGLTPHAPRSRRRIDG